MIYFILVLVFYGAISTTVAVVQYQRCSKLEQITNTVVAHFEKLNQLIKNSEELLENPRLKEAFAHDDEVGGYFKNLESIQEILSRYYIEDNG